jgi:hypothetical protein
MADNLNQIINDHDYRLRSIESSSRPIQGLTGIQGIQGTTGPSGVIAVTAPITNSGTSTSATIGIQSASDTQAGAVTTGTQTFSGEKTFTSTINLDGIVRAQNVYDNTTGTAANVNVNAAGRLLRSTASSMRYKTDIKPVENEELDPYKLLGLTVYQYKFREDYLSSDDLRYNQDVIGFIAEDVDEHYPIAANYNDDGSVERWDANYVVPGLLKIIQDQQIRLEILENKLRDSGL